MIVLLSNIVLMIIENALLRPDENQRGRKVFCFLVACQWILLAGLRAHDVGVDTTNYRGFFNNYLFLDLDFVFSGFLSEYFGANGYAISDGGFYLIMKVFQVFSDSYQLWLFFLAVTFFVPLSLFIYTESPHPFMSWLLFSTVFYTFFAFSAARQALALSIAVFIGFYAVKSKKPFLFILLVLIAFTIHKSAIIFLPFYVLYYSGFSRRSVALYICAGIIALLFGNQIVSLAGDVFESYSRYATSGYVGSNTMLYGAALLLFAGFLYWRRHAIAARFPDAPRLYHGLAFSLIVIPIAFINSNVFRAAYYYMIMLIVLLPMFTCSFPKRESVLINYVASFVLIVFMVFIGPVNDGAEYHFFWS